MKMVKSLMVSEKVFEYNLEAGRTNTGVIP